MKRFCELKFQTGVFFDQVSSISGDQMGSIQYHNELSVVL